MTDIRKEEDAVVLEDWVTEDRIIITSPDEALDIANNLLEFYRSFNLT